MKLKVKIASWLRRLANFLDPEIMNYDVKTDYHIFETTHNLQKVAIKLNYPDYMYNQNPNFDVIVAYNLAHKLAEKLATSDAMKITKQNEGNDVSFVAELKVLSPYG